LAGKYSTQEGASSASTCQTCGAGNPLGTQGASSWSECVSTSTETNASCSADEMAKFHECVAEYLETDNCEALKTGAECAPTCWCSDDHKNDLQIATKLMNGCSDVICGSLIGEVDWLFVGFSIFFEVWTWLYIVCKAGGIAEVGRCAGCGVACSYVPCALIASVGCSVGKLYPVKYYCVSRACAKLVHNAVMTLVAFPFDLGEAFAVKEIEVRGKHSGFGVIWKTLKLLGIQVRGKYSGIGVILKSLNILGTLVYLIYDTVRYPPPGPGSMALVILGFVCECLLIVIEVVTVCQAARRPHKEPEPMAVGWA